MFVQYPLAFIADSNTGVSTLDVSNPPYTEVISNTPLPYSGYDVFYQEPFLYAAFGTSINVDEGGLQVIDASNLAAPVKSGSVEFDWTATKVVVSGTSAFLRVNIQGFQVVDVSDPSNPTVVHADPTLYPLDMEVDGSLVYMTAGGSLRVMDISTPASPTQIGSLPIAGAKGLDVLEDRAFVADGAPRFHVVDVSDPTLPVLMHTVPTLGNTNDVAVEDGLIYVAGTYGIEAYSMVGSATPTPIGFLKTSEHALDIEVTLGKAYAAVGREGMLIVQYQIPEPPAGVGEWKLYE